MKKIIHKITPQKAGFVLLSALLLTFTGLFTMQAHADDNGNGSQHQAGKTNDARARFENNSQNSANNMDINPSDYFKNGSERHFDSANWNGQSMPSPMPTGTDMTTPTPTTPTPSTVDTTTPTPSPTSTDSPTPSAMPTGMDMSTGTGMDTNATGFTDGWFQGRTVTFFYHNKDFYCQNPPASGATSNCEAGADAQSMPPQADIPPLYVMTPLGFTPSGLQCPTAGNCINHPHTIDLSAVLGAGTENAQLPPHSHIIDAADPGWWKIVVIGVKSQADWDKIAAGKDLATVRSLQQSDPTNVTADIPTNSFLFFDVLSHGNYQVNGSQLTNESQ